MPAIGPEWSAARQKVIDVTCDANRNAAHACGEFALVFGFHDEVHVVALHRKSAGINRQEGKDERA